MAVGSPGTFTFDSILIATFVPKKERINGVTPGGQEAEMFRGMAGKGTVDRSL